MDNEPSLNPVPAGSIDIWENGRIAGWVRVAGAPPPALELWNGAERIGTCVANLHRTDLQAAGVGDGHHGFRFEPPSLGLRDLAACIITIGSTGSVIAPDARMPVPREQQARSIYRRNMPYQKRRFTTGILHIGTEKTGTSTLQKFLFQKRDQLARRGVFLPVSLTPHAGAQILNHEYLPMLAAADGYVTALQSCEISGADALHALRVKIFSQLDQEVDAAPAHCTRLLVSSEHCHSRVVTPSSIHHVRALLHPFCDQFEIHVYLRPQHELAMSRYGMALMLGVADGNPLPRMPLGPPKGEALYFNYQALLERWAAVFGEAALRPHIFERPVLAGGSVTNDFVIALGLQFAGLAPATEIGANVSPAAQHFLRRLYDTPRGQALPVEACVWISERLREVAPGRGAMPSRSDAQNFMNQFAASNEEVRKRWFPKRPSLFATDLSNLKEQVEAIGTDAATERQFDGIVEQAQQNVGRISEA